MRKLFPLHSKEGQEIQVRAREERREGGRAEGRVEKDEVREGDTERRRKDDESSPCLLASAVESDVGREQEWEGAREREKEGRRASFPSSFPHSLVGGAICLAGYPRSFSHHFFSFLSPLLSLRTGPKVEMPLQMPHPLCCLHRCCPRLLLSGRLPPFLCLHSSNT